MSDRPRILNPDMDAAVTAALAMHPDRPGVGRLCQELLSRMAHRPITAAHPSQLFFPQTQHPKPVPAHRYHNPRLAALAKKIARLERMISETKQ